MGTDHIVGTPSGPNQIGDFTTISYTKLPNVATGEYLDVRLPLRDLTVKVLATALILVGQTWSSSATIATKTSTSGLSSPVPTTGGGGLNDERQRTWIGVSIGGTIGLVVLLGIGFLILRRYRKNRRGQATIMHDGQPRKGSPEGGRNEYGVEKPELEGSHGTLFMGGKPELDANATRAELEGDVAAELEAITRAELAGSHEETDQTAFGALVSELEETSCVARIFRGVTVMDS